MVSTEPWPWQRAPLAQTLATQRAHALLLHGAQDSGPLAFALALARAWLCETPAAERPDGLACGHCTGCHLVDERAHPDLRVVVPETLREAAGLGGDDTPGAESSDGGSRKTRKPSAEIKVDAVRAALDFAALTPSRARLKVLVVHPAEALNAVAANALLKTLEEPPGAMRFLLGCGAPHALLPTIRSRCQAVALPTPERAAALAWLAAQGVADADIVLDACGGEPLAALEHARAGRDAAVWRQFPAAIAQGQVAAVAGWPLPVLVDALQKLCHDRALRALGEPARYFPFLADERPVPLDRLTALAGWLRAQARHADHPWSAPLAVDALVQRVSGVLAARPSPSASSA
jgi:DNA polymerase-3 subunit delta'